MKHVPRCLALLALAAAGCKPVDLDALGARLQDPKTSEAAAAELAKLGAAAVPALIQGTLSESPVVRSHALARLTLARGLYDHQPVAAERIIALLDDHDPGVRAAAIQAVATYCERRWDGSMTTKMHDRNVDDMRPARTIILKLLEDQNPDVRGTAAATLPDICRHIAGKDDVPTLVAGLASDDVRVRRGCAQALGAVGDPLAIDSLFLCMSGAGDQDPETALAAADAILHCDPVPPKVFTDALDSKYESRRVAAAFALGVLGGLRTISYPYGHLRQQALEVLRQRRKRERTERVRAAINAAIHKIESAMKAEGVVPPKPDEPL